MKSKLHIIIRAQILKKTCISTNPYYRCEILVTYPIPKRDAWNWNYSVLQLPPERRPSLVVSATRPYWASRSVPVAASSTSTALTVWGWSRYASSRRNTARKCPSPGRQTATCGNVPQATRWRVASGQLSRFAGNTFNINFVSRQKE